MALDPIELNCRTLSRKHTLLRFALSVEYEAAKKGRILNGGLGFLCTYALSEKCSFAPVMHVEIKRRTYKNQDKTHQAIYSRGVALTVRLNILCQSNAEI